MVDSDGTQAPEPPKPFSDPLGGNAADGRSSPTLSGTTGSGDLGVARPVEVNREAVRQLLEAEQAEQAEAAASGEPAPVDTDDDEPTAEIPPQQPATVRASRPSALPPILRLRKQSGARSRPRPHVRKPSSGSTGLAVALVLLVIFILVAIQFVVSFVESVTGLFG
ncbi:hypothetical protein B1813_12045 [Saccharomonospora piscinae]|uniref:Uncharacterized protein n=1 Tax=Saccharomonospora piscinae TaxID=687388 RepID=A0A1V9A8J2_SACPI|nr:hypothetical protein [Saccharomonospora piscinae]OQO93234.1 hypothetical protein B1813_12045 [Saccharomonospora piscinae]